MALMGLIVPLLVGGLPGQTASTASSRHIIKIATLAPEGSAWMQVFEDINTAVATQSENRLGFRVYPGGVLGDETDMLRKMFIGQIHGAVLTASTLSSVFAEIEVTQMPFLFRNYDEVDHVMKRMTPFFKSGLAANGYTLLGWSEGGFVRLMSTRPVATLDDLKASKVWTWKEAPMTRAIFKEADVSGIPLAVPDVLVGLQTGLVEVVYAPPAGAISLQWFTRIKYITDVPLMYLAGGVVVKKDVIEALPADLRTIVQNEFQRHDARLKAVVRNGNRDALSVMQQHGITLIKPSADQVAEFKALAERAMQIPGSRVFSDAVLEKITQELKTYRENR
jgi:TRAP-type C4-dicarboxylate transport system substrate-binding protein